MFHSRRSIEREVSSLWQLGGLTGRELSRRLWRDIVQNDLANRSYELAYNFLFAVFPFLLFLTSLFGTFASDAGKMRLELFLYFQPALPPSAYGLVARTLREITQNAGGGKLTLGLVFAMFAALSGMAQMISTLNAAYGVREERSWVKVHLISLGLTTAMSALVVAAVLLVFAGSGFLQVLGLPGRWASSLAVAGSALQLLMAVAFVAFGLALVYYYGPNVKDQHWYWITPGSVVGVLLWAVVSAGLRIYLHFSNTFSATYGSLGAVMVLMLWFYVTGLAFLIGGQINSTIEHAAAEHGHPEAKLPGSKVA